MQHTGNLFETVFHMDSSIVSNLDTNDIEMEYLNPSIATRVNFAKFQNDESKLGTKFCLPLSETFHVTNNIFLL